MAEITKDSTPSEIRSELTELRNEFVAHEGKERSAEWRTGLRDLLDKRESLDAQLSILEAVERGEKRQRQEGLSFNPATAPVTPEVRSIGRQVIEDAEMRTWLEGDRSVTSPKVKTETRAVVGIGDADAVKLAPVQQPELAYVWNQPFFVRQLMRSAPTKFNSIPYVRELNAVTNQASASTVAEGALKPEAGFDLQTYYANVQVIAHTITVSNQLLDDYDAVMAYINDELRYRLAYREEQQILSGLGTGADLKGILSYTTGDYTIQTQSATSGDHAVTIANAFSKVAQQLGQAGAVVMNEQDYWTMVIKRASTSGVFDAGTPFAGAPVSIWGHPIVRSLSIAQGKALVADWSGARIWDRSGEDVQFFPQHSDYAQRNLTLIRAEKRLALQVTRPEVFVYCTLA